MALAELGHRYNCPTALTQAQAEEIEVAAGDIYQYTLQSDVDITPRDAAKLIHEIVKLKNDYPESLIHYVKIEKRQVIVQCSVAPPGGSVNSPFIWGLVVLVLALIGLVLVARWTVLTIYTLFFAPPTGHAQIYAKNWETKAGISGVQITLADRSGKTDGKGSVIFKDLDIGDYLVSGEGRDGFHPPTTKNVHIEKDRYTYETIWYVPEYMELPTRGRLEVYTTPVRGMVLVAGQEIGLAPQVLELDIGEYMVSFGAVEEYITPDPRPVTIDGLEITTTTGRYELIKEHPLEKYAKYALIGGGVILGAALIVPELIRGLRK